MNNLIKRTVKHSNVTLELDRPESSANVIDMEFFEELNIHLKWLEKHPELKSLVIMSAKKGIFVAGADLNQFKKGLQMEEIKELIRAGHRTFLRLSNVPQVSVAAIHGICVGGGLELALACDYRIATDERSTKIGLPEVNLGILPGWGGTSRLPRMIGLRKALYMILSGKQLNSSSALRIGVIDGKVKQERLLAASFKVVSKGKRTYPLFPFENHPITTAMIKHQARKNILKKTRGNYPAPLLALDVAVRGLRGGLLDSFRLEEDAFLQLMDDSVSNNLVSLFFLTERAKRVQIQDVSQPPLPVNKIAVVGAGIMGSGIAQWCAAREMPTVLKDISPEAVGRGLGHINKIMNDGVKRKTFTKVEARDTLDRITPAHSNIPLCNQDLVIEAVIEKLDLKQHVIRDLEKRTHSNAVIATNTSALSIDSIANAMDRPDRLVGIHFFNPVHRMKLVEIIRGTKTSEKSLNTALNFVKKIGKLPVLVKDSPGFLVNRILMPYLFEAVRLYDSGFEVNRIDEVMMDFGMPMGPLRLIDEVGVDVANHVATDLLNRLPHPFPKTGFLDKMIAHNALGKKSGNGFYDYRGKKTLVNTGIDIYRSSGSNRTLEAKELCEMMVILMINEGARCLEESVVNSPEDVDFGMVMGTGFAPFRGGPMRYADSIGAKAVVSLLEKYRTSQTPHFMPCDLLIEMARKEEPFYPEKRSTVNNHPSTDGESIQNRNAA